MKHDQDEHPAGIERCPVRIYTGTTWQAAVANIVREVRLEVYLNGKKMITIACAGIHTEELTVGWLRAEGFITTAREIEAVEVNRDGLSINVHTKPELAGLVDKGSALPIGQGAPAAIVDGLPVTGKPVFQSEAKDAGMIISSSGARGAAMGMKGSGGKTGLSGSQSRESEIVTGGGAWKEEGAGEGRNVEAMKPLAIGTETISPVRIFMLMEKLVAAAGIHNLSRGTHGAALADSSDIIVTREDIGRHNCLDMLSGYALLHEIECADKVLLRTGRVSSEIVHKIWRMGVPVVLSLSAPTALAISLARQVGITLVGAIRAPSLTVYTLTKRIRG